jgi:membrane-bound ClpP family serine protease
LAIGSILIVLGGILTVARGFSTSLVVLPLVGVVLLVLGLLWK